VFRKKYPFIDVKATEISGTDTYVRMLGELKIGKTTDWDINYVAFDYYDDYLPHQKKFDLLGMARHGVLKIPPDMIDPVHRHILALQSNMQAFAYNKKMLPKEKAPDTFEDLLRPEFKGKKFATDIRPRAVAALVPAWGLEKVLAYAKNLAAQQPIWTRGDTRSLPYMTGGEIAMTLGLNYKSYLRFKKKDVQDVLDVKVLEPVPVRITEAEGISATARNPYAALLWLEFQASAEGQAILDETDLAASHLSSGSFHEKALRGKKLSVIDWKHYLHMERYQDEVVKAFGFPRADK
jgi:ABC-type Fe3+ transport system substrate-binding protein